MKLLHRFFSCPVSMRPTTWPDVVALVVYGAASFLLVYFLSTTLGDDAYFLEFLRDFRLAYLENLYQNWTPRLLPMSLAFYMVHAPVFFKVVTFAILMTIPLMLYYLLSYWRGARLWVILAACFMYPIGDMQSSGWVATLCNYVYVLFAMLASMCILLRKFIYGKTSPVSLVALFFLLVFGTNHEQSLVILFVYIASLLFCSYSRNKKLPAVFLFSLVIWGLAALNFLLCPGNENRIAFDTASFFPEFISFSAVYKAYLGYITTAHRYFFTLNTLYSVFSLLLAFSLCEKYGYRKIFFIPAIVPVVYTLLFTVYFDMDGRYIVTVASMSSPFPYFVFFLATATACTLIIYLYFLFGMGKDLILSLAIIGLGLGSRMLVGFSPVILVSPTRISLYADVAFVALAGVLYPLCSTRGKKVAAYIVCGAAVLQLARNVFS